MTTNLNIQFSISPVTFFTFFNYEKSENPITSETFAQFVIHTCFDSIIPTTQFYYIAFPKSDKKNIYREQIKLSTKVSTRIGLIYIATEMEQHNTNSRS